MGQDARDIGRYDYLKNVQFIRFSNLGQKLIFSPQRMRRDVYQRLKFLTLHSGRHMAEPANSKHRHDPSYIIQIKILFLTPPLYELCGEMFLISGMAWENKTI